MRYYIEDGWAGPLLGPKYAAELIQQAHNDIKKGLHKTVNQETKFYVTNIECACGCGTCLGSKAVKQGWRFVRGHKKTNVHDAAKLVRMPDKPKLSPPKQTSFPLTLQFIEMELQLVNERSKELHKENEVIEAKLVANEKQLDVLSDKRHNLEIALSAVKNLIPKGQLHVSG